MPQLIPDELYSGITLGYPENAPSKYSFRYPEDKKSEYKEIHIFPNSVKRAYGDSDISFPDGSIFDGYKEILSKIPYIHIREYRISPFLNDILTNGKMFLEGFMDAKKLFENGNNLEVIGKHLKNFMEEFLSFENIKRLCVESCKKVLDENVGVDFGYGLNMFEEYRELFLRFPFFLYYRIMQT